MNKISPQFAARIARLKPAQRIRAVILLNAPQAAVQANGRRRTLEERQATITETRSSVAEAVKEIDDLLRPFGGSRLSDQPTALGTVVVESPAAGLSALADSDYVKAIMEDQAISKAL